MMGKYRRLSRADDNEEVMYNRKADGEKGRNKKVNLLPVESGLVALCVYVCVAESV